MVVLHLGFVVEGNKNTFWQKSLAALTSKILPRSLQKFFGVSKCLKSIFCIELNSLFANLVLLIIVMQK
jgi:hypothetical protein